MDANRRGDKERRREKEKKRDKERRRDKERQGRQKATLPSGSSHQVVRGIS